MLTSIHGTDSVKVTETVVIGSSESTLTPEVTTGQVGVGITRLHIYHGHHRAIIIYQLAALQPTLTGSYVIIIIIITETCKAPLTGGTQRRRTIQCQ